MKSLGDAIELRNHLVEQLEEADSECVKDKNALLAFVVVGGGFAGVETVAGIDDFVCEVLASYSHFREAMLRVVLVHAATLVLPELGAKLGTYAQKKLASHCLVALAMHLPEQIEFGPAFSKDIVEFLTASETIASRTAHRHAPLQPVRRRPVRSHRYAFMSYSEDVSL